MSADVADILFPQVLEVHPTVHPHLFVLLVGGGGCCQLLEGMAAPGWVFVGILHPFTGRNGGVAGGSEHS